MTDETPITIPPTALETFCILVLRQADNDARANAREIADEVTATVAEINSGNIEAQREISSDDMRWLMHQAMLVLDVPLLKKMYVVAHGLPKRMACDADRELAEAILADLREVIKRRDIKIIAPLQRKRIITRGETERN